MRRSASSAFARIRRGLPKGRYTLVAALGLAALFAATLPTSTPAGADDEGDDTILASGSTTVGLDVSSSEITLTDHSQNGESDSAQISISGPTSPAAEGGNASFTLTLSHAVAAEVTVAWSAPSSDDTAVAADLGNTSGSVTIPASTSQLKFNIPIFDDDLEEDAETFTVTLGDITSTVSSQVSVDASAGSAIATISESDEQDQSLNPSPSDPPPPSTKPTGINLSVSPDSIAEDDGPTTVTLEGEGTLDADTTITISLAGTATEDTDYTVSTALASITIPSGQSTGSGTMTLSPSEDEIIEEPESILITGSPSGLGNDSAAITLTDATDGEGEVVMAYLGIASPSEETPEGSYARFTLNLSQAVTADLTVSYKVIPGTADPSDYVEQSGVVTFVAHSPTDLTETITITINEDPLSEGTETFTVVLQDVSGEQASRVLIDTARASAQGIIAESDPITVNLHGPQSVDEGDSATYTVSRRLESFPPRT